MIRETADELRTIAESCNDVAGYFPALYSRVTTHIANSIDAHEFADGDRMNAFVNQVRVRATPVPGKGRSRDRGAGRHRGTSPTTGAC